MPPRRYTPEQIQHVADVFIAAHYNGRETVRRLNEEEGFERFTPARLYHWLTKNTHDFQAEVKKAADRAQRREVADPITATENVIRSIQDRLALFEDAHGEAIILDKVGEAMKIEAMLIKEEAHLLEAQKFLHLLKNPKEGDAAQEAVRQFVIVLINNASPRQREVIADVAGRLLPEGAIDAGA